MTVFGVSSSPLYSIDLILYRDEKMMSVLDDKLPRTFRRNWATCVNKGSRDKECHLPEKVVQLLLTGKQRESRDLSMVISAS